MSSQVYSAYQGLVQNALYRWRLAKIPNFNNLLKDISSGAAISSDDVLPYISLESKEERLLVNFALAEAFYDIGKCEQAKVFIQRVWEFSGFEEKYLPLFIKIHAINDIEFIRKAHKELGMKKSSEGKLLEALNHFNAWQYSYAVHRQIDEYQYDYEILNRIEQLARPHKFPLRHIRPLNNRKTRLAYLMFGMLHSNSVIVKISLLFAKYHNPSQFEITFYVPEQASRILEYQEAIDNIKIIKELGWNVVMAPDAVSEEESLIHLSKSIYEFHPDLLITSAALSDLKHYFITSLQPAPLIIGLCQGPPAQFIAPSFDWSISWFRSLIIDCPTGCSYISLRLDLPKRKYSHEEAKSFFGIPKGDLILMSAGRAAKFQDMSFWKAIIEVLRSHPHACYFAVGLAGQTPLFLSELLTPDVAQRVKILGWEKDFHKVLSMADVVIDTYPSGGGVVIKDAMALGIPVVSFKHDYMKTFSQTECSAAEEVIGMLELVVERGDFEAFKKVLSKLVTDQQYRENLAELCIKRITETSGNPELMVKNCEQVYLNVMQKSVLVAT